jgi:hypothetical protein
MLLVGTFLLLVAPRFGGAFFCDFPARTFFRIDKIEGTPKSPVMTIWATEAEAF